MVSDDFTQEELAELGKWNYHRSQGEDVTEEDLAQLEEWNFSRG